MLNTNNIPLSLSYDDVLLIPQYSKINSRQEVDISTHISKNIKLNIPLITANMSDVTGVKMAIEIGKLGGLGVLPRFKTIEQQTKEVLMVKKEIEQVAAAVGARDGLIERAEAVAKSGATILVLDVAHGHMQKTIEATSKLRNHFGQNITIISGNTATFDATDALFTAGADCVKVGVGPGSICTTRIETGSGVPQLTAVIESAKAARKHKKYILADGGIKNSGDIVKALAAGASAIMAGSIFAGLDESPGEIVKRNGKKYKVYNASTSITEKTKHSFFHPSGLEKHYVKQIEGVESIVPYKGKLSDFVDRTTANIKSGLSYSGAKNIHQLWKLSKFTRITSQGLKESGAHDVLLYNTH